MSKITVLGAGSWGTALAMHIAKIHSSVTLWSHRKDHALDIKNKGENEQYLPNIKLPQNLSIEHDFNSALKDAEGILIVVPSKAFSQTITQIRDYFKSSNIQKEIPILWATKGLEHGTGKFLHTVLDEHFSSHYPYGILSGPSFAKEVANNLPTAVVVASKNQLVFDYFKPLFHHHYFRVYTNSDIIGVEIGGAYKNVIAIAAGVSDSLNFGSNARAALITRGLVEMQRLGVALNARMETFMGLSGLGDLVLTATDDQSRNRRFGLLLGKCVDFKSAEQEIGQVVEGATTARELLRLSQLKKIELPIVEEIFSTIYENRNPLEAATNLLSRQPKNEYK